MFALMIYQKMVILEPIVCPITNCFCSIWYTLNKHQLCCFHTCFYLGLRSVQFGFGLSQTDTEQIGSVSVSVFNETEIPKSNFGIIKKSRFASYLSIQRS